MNEVTTETLEKEDEYADLRQFLKTQAMLLALNAKSLRAVEQLCHQSIRAKAATERQLDFLAKNMSNVPDAATKLKRIRRSLARSRNRAADSYYTRVNLLRPDARAIHLIRGWLSGKPYKVVENNVTKQKELSEPVLECVIGACERLSFSAEERSKVEKWVAGE